MKKRKWCGRIFGNFISCALLLTVTLVFSAWGEELEWLTQAGGISEDRSLDMANDKAGNNYITGFFNDTATFGPDQTNETDLTSSGGRDIFVAKYDRNGNLLWVRQAGGPNEDSGRSIAVDEEGKVFITGSFSDGVTFGSGELNETSFDSSGFFVAQYSEDGDLIWILQTSALGNDIAIDSTGNIYITGDIEGTVTFGEGEENEIELTSLGRSDIYVAKYDGGGNLLWVTQAGGNGDDVSEFGRGITVDNEGNSYVTGQFALIATFGAGEANETVLDALGFAEHDIFVAKYASDGRLLWARQAGSDRDDFDDFGTAIAVDETGNSYVTGSFLGPAVFGIGEASETILGDVNQNGAFVAKYTDEGNLLWATSVDSPISEVEIHSVGTSDIAIDEKGNSYVTGIANIIGPFDTDVMIAKFSGDGNLVFFKLDGSSGQFSNDSGTGIAVEKTGDFYVTGFFNDTATFGSDGEATTIDSFGDIDIFVTKYGADDIQDLMNLIESFELRRGLENSLLVKLRNAQNSLKASNAGKRQNAANILQAFINEVEAQRGLALTDEQAEELVEGAQEIMMEI